MPEPANSVLIRHLALKNFLSFGPENAGIDLRALNLLIGPNGSGKSNLIEAVNLMRSAPKEFGEVTGQAGGGGVEEWIWKGKPGDSASIECVFNTPSSPTPLRHEISFGLVAQAFALTDERVEETEPRQINGEDQVRFHYRHNGGHPQVTNARNVMQWLANDLKRDRSILAELRDARAYPELNWLAQSYERIRIYREWAFGKNAVFRNQQRADMRNEVMEEDFSNLGLYLSRLKTRFPKAKKAILHSLKDLYDGITDFDVSVAGGTVQVFFTEGDYVIPATRLSDGTLRYLCLLAILCDPEPPPLICIEEPELGLHPDILPKVADLLRTASERTQIIVTTHSDILVDAMTETPEAVVVCEKHDGQTQMNRLSAEELAKWLEKYRLGQLWIQGQIGGTRW